MSLVISDAEVFIKPGIDIARKFSYDLYYDTRYRLIAVFLKFGILASTAQEIASTICLLSRRSTLRPMPGAVENSNLPYRAGLIWNVSQCNSSDKQNQ